MPDRLFKYQPFNAQTLRNLKDRTLWFSAPNRFNDPFDCALSVFDANVSDADLLQLFKYSHAKVPNPAHFENYAMRDGVPTDEFRQSSITAMENVLAETRRSHFERRGVASFGESATNLLMWGHYADGHRGFCLEFDGTVDPFSTAMKVTYSSDFPKVNPVNLFRDDAKFQDIIEPMMLTKARCWEYENEWRVLHAQANHAYTYPWSALKGIHLGASMPEVDIEIIALILRDSPTKLFKAERSETAFVVNSREFRYTPFDYGSGS